MSNINFHLVTLFPEAFGSYISASVIGRALEQGKVRTTFYNPRDYSKDPHQRVDRRPYGGGPGMVIQAEPVIRAVEKAAGRKSSVRVVFLSPAGDQFDNQRARQYAREVKHLILVAGRYEGIDERAYTGLAERGWPVEKLSIGPYILTGGELPAMVVLDAVSRQIPGVLGDKTSLEEERTASRRVYTRPESFRYKQRTYPVPEVLRSGHHRQIEEWKKGEGIE